MITALGEVWHPEHFVCVVCETELSSTVFFERDGHPYCDKDYHHLFSPRCAYCNGAIRHVKKTFLSITALIMTYQFEFLSVNIIIISQPRPKGLTVLCNLSIFQNILTALDQNWHPEHFFCAHCGGLFGSEGRGGLHIHFSFLGNRNSSKQLEII